MQEQRRHQRVRFSLPPPVRLGHCGVPGTGFVENISMSGLMLRTDLKLSIGHAVGCEFSAFGPAQIDMTAGVVSRVGDVLYGLRFQPGLLHPILIEDAIHRSLATGQGSVLSMHELGGRRVMRIAGGLTGALRNDFMHALTRGGVDELDLSEVTAVDQGGLALCLVATERHGAGIGARSDTFAVAWAQALATTGGAARIQERN